MKTRIAVISIICSLVAAGCMLNLTDAGPGSETTNGKVVAGVVIVPDGTSASQSTTALQTIVRLVPRAYNPVTGLPLPDRMTDTTDHDGKYVFRFSDTGVFNIQAVNSATGGQLLIREIPVFQDTTMIPSDTLRMPGTVNIMLPSDADFVNGYVYIPGTSICTYLKGTKGNMVAIDNVPSNVPCPINYATPVPGAAVRTLLENVLVSPGGDITTLYSSWKHFRKVVLNTTLSGANVMNTVYNFPVLVRLNKSNFVFSEAQANGNDIVFTKSDHSELPFEIERWDPGNGRAEIWVHVDTILGNRATQSITMYWGNSREAAVTSGQGVFDTAHGFRGVWHLADNGPNSRVIDATGKNEGVMKAGDNSINTSSAYINGIAGGAARFRGRTNYQWVDLGANKAFVNNTSDVTISAWMNAESDTFSTKDLICFSKGDTLSALEPESRANIAISFDRIVFSVRATDRSARVAMRSTRTFIPKKWYHIAGVMKVSRDSLYLYVNGELWGSASVPFNAAATSPTNSTSSAIGANDVGSDDYFYGIIDEARIEDQARSADWIKLSFMNQKEVDALLK